MSLDPAAVTGILGVAIGTVLTAILTNWTSRQGEARAERRMTRAADSARQLEALRQTRRRSHEVVQQLKALAIKPAPWQLSEQTESANDALIGEADVIREYRELLVDLQTRFGRGLPTETSLRSAMVLADIDRSISQQEERVRQGEPPLVLGRDLAEELFDMDAFSKRLLTVNQPPTLQGLLARGFLDALRAIASIRLAAASRRR
jgi:type II secretory pathway pseudopilin PulG